MQNTTEQYTKRAESIIASYEKQTGVKASDDWEAFLKTIHARAPMLSSATRRQYRCALKYYLITNKGINWAEVSSPDFLQAEENRKKVKSKMGLRTSQLKYKRLPSKHFDELLRFLEKSSSKHAKLSYYLLLASSYYGLRPSEWVSAQFVFDGTESQISRYSLVVKNGKNSQGRAHGESRTLWFNVDLNDQNAMPTVIFGIANDLIDSLKAAVDPEKEIRNVRNFLSQVYARNAQFKKYRGKKRITLYSARHQFAADAKKQGLSKTVIAALMGHRSDHTATKSYGRKAWGGGAIGVEADPEDVQKVEDFNQKEPVADLDVEPESFGLRQ